MTGQSREFSIEKTLVLLSAGVAVLFLVFIAAFLWVQATTAEGQHLSDDVVHPIRSNAIALKDGLNELFLRQAKIGAADTVAEVQELRSRDNEEAAIKAAHTHLAQLWPNLAAGAAQPQLLTAIDQAVDDFLAQDAIYFQAYLRMTQTRAKLDEALDDVDAKVKDFQQTVQGLSGKIRFAYGSSVRRINRLVGKSGFNAEAQRLVSQQVLHSSSLKNGLVTEVLSLSEELSALVNKVGLVRNGDQLNNLIANELVQNQERLVVNLNDLKDEVGYDPELVQITSSLQESVAALGHRILDEQNTGSLYALKRSLLAEQRLSREATAKLTNDSHQVTGGLRTLITLIDAASRDLTLQTEQVARETKILLGLLTLIGLSAGAFGSQAVRRSLQKLRSTNADLLRLKEELTQVNTHLESTVEERTRTIRTILDHVQFGFFLCDLNLKVDSGYTLSCETLLHRGEVAGHTVPEVLGLSGKASTEFSLQMSQLFDDIMPEEVVLAQVPSRFKIEGRVLQLSGSVVRDAKGAIAKVLFCLADISSLEAAEQENRDNRVLLRILKNPDQFRRFIADTKAGLAAARAGQVAGDEAALRRELHTVKGNLGVYELHQIAHGVHMIEGQTSIVKADIASIEAGIKAFLAANFQVLAISYEADGVELYQVAAKDADALEQAVTSAPSLQPLQETLRAFLFNLRMKQAKVLLGPLGELCTNLAARLGKQISYELRGQELKIPPQQAAPVLAVLPHLIRNAIDHGIELPWERGSKSETATISLSFSEDQTHWQIELSDDGRGIDVERVRRKAESLGHVAPGAQLSHDQLCQLIFMPNLSTAETVTDVSGRGVGMGAVAEAVTAAGGTIAAHSTFGHGMSVVLRLPKLNAAQVRWIKEQRAA